MLDAEQLQTINPDITPDVIRSVDAIIAPNRNKPGGLIPVLGQCQESFGYLPVELQEYVAQELNIPASTVYGVVTFYSYFSMLPKGRNPIKVCMGTACYVLGVGEVLERLKSELGLEVGTTTEDRRFSLEAVRCLGACGLAPVVVVGPDTHGGVTADRIMDILHRYE